MTLGLYGTALDLWLGITCDEERGEVARITALPERTARRVLNDVVGLGLLASQTPKGPVSLRFPADAVDMLFPKLFPET